jgi:cellulose synthase/poly-beta-1,6-N-acetylglucosamine synthase-like glycosyltransferase
MEFFFLSLFCPILVSLAALHIFLMGAQIWEHRRFARSRRNNIPSSRPDGHVAVFVPCKGVDIDLEQNLRALFCQDDDDYELVFVVEERSDPAYQVISNVAKDYPTVSCRIVLAGQAIESGQKVHNLRFATASLDKSIEYLVFMDSDAQPRPEWLRTLVARLGDDSRVDLGAVTGYRWMVPARAGLGNWLLVAINGATMSLYGAKARYPIWGGAWAIRRNLFDQTRIRDEWKQTLSDDLVASSILHRHGRKVEFEPACVVTTPVDFSLFDSIAFLRRQYMIARFYAFRWWLGGLVLAIFPVVVWWGTLVGLIHAVISGSPSAAFWAIGCGTLYLLSAVRAQMRQTLTRVYSPDWWAKSFAARWFDILCGPVVGVFNLIGLLASAWGNRFRWRSIEYKLSADGKSQIVSRELPSDDGSQYYIGLADLDNLQIEPSHQDIREVVQQ